MPTEQITLSERERQAVQAAAEQWGISFQEAADRLLKEALEQRFRRGTGRAPAKVYELRRPK